MKKKLVPKPHIPFNICPGCNEMVYSDDKKFMQASDRPVYKNVFWHEECWKLRKVLKNKQEP